MIPEGPLPLKKVKFDDIFGENEELTLEVLDNEPGFYQSTMRAMLLPGHEGELCIYLKEMGLILRSVRCHGSPLLPKCTSSMKWTQARIIDKYTWKCEECNHRCSIREDSFFKSTKCSLMTTIRIILGWCKDLDPENISSVLNIKPNPIKRLYETCSQVVADYVHKKKHEWKLGGENIIVLVDVYPTIFGAQPEIQNNNSTQILCLAETKVIPTQYWFHVLHSDDRESINEEIIEVIQTMVRPGSVIVTEKNSKTCSQNIFADLDGYFNVAIEQLIKHNRPECNIFQILDTIWQPAIDICNEAQKYPPQLVQAFLYNQLWRRKFAKTPSSALEYFLHHIAEQYPLTQL